MKRGKRYAVAASGQWTDEEEGRRRLPAGEVHAWEPGRNETVCGLSLSRSRLVRFSHVNWPISFCGTVPSSCASRAARPTRCGGCARVARRWPDAEAVTRAHAGCASATAHDMSAAAHAPVSRSPSSTADNDSVL